MGIHAYQLAADGSDFDETWLNEDSAAGGRITGVGLYPVSSASYLIFEVPSLYYRRNGITGIIDDSNANAGALIQAALSAL